MRPPSPVEVMTDRQRETALHLARDLRLFLRATDPDLARLVGEVEEELMARRLLFEAGLRDKGDER